MKDNLLHGLSWILVMRIYSDTKRSQEVEYDEQQLVGQWRDRRERLQAADHGRCVYDLLDFFGSILVQ